MPPAVRPPPIPQAKSMIPSGRGIKPRQPAPSSLEGAPSAPIGKAEIPVGRPTTDIAVQKVTAIITDNAAPAIKAVFEGKPVTVPAVHEQLTAIAAGTQVTETNSQTGANEKPGAEPNNGTQPEAAVEGAPAPAGTRLRTAAEIASDGGSTVLRNETPTSPVAEDDFEAAIAGVHAEQVAARPQTQNESPTPTTTSPEKGLSPADEQIIERQKSEQSTTDGNLREKYQVETAKADEKLTLQDQDVEDIEEVIAEWHKEMKQAEEKREELIPPPTVESLMVPIRPLPPDFFGMPPLVQRAYVEAERALHNDSSSRATLEGTTLEEALQISPGRKAEIDLWKKFIAEHPDVTQQYRHQIPALNDAFTLVEQDQQAAATQATAEPAPAHPAPTPEPAPNQPETGEWKDPLAESDRNYLNATFMELANKLISVPENEFNPIAFAETIIARNAKGELGAIFSVGALQDLQKQGLLPNTDQMKAMITNLAASLPNGAQPLLERAVAQGILTQTEADGLLPQNPAESTNYGEVTHTLLTKKNKNIDPAKVKLDAGLIAQKRTLFEPESLLDLGIAETPHEAQQLANYFSTLPQDTRTILEKMAHIGDSGIHNFMNILMLISMLSSLSGEQGQGH